MCVGGGVRGEWSGRREEEEEDGEIPPLRRPRPLVSHKGVHHQSDGEMGRRDIVPQLSLEEERKKSILFSPVSSPSLSSSSSLFFTPPLPTTPPPPFSSSSSSLLLPQAPSVPFQLTLQRGRFQSCVWFLVAVFSF